MRTKFRETLWFKKGQQDAAVELIERAIALHPSVPEFHRNLANHEERGFHLPTTQQSEVTLDEFRQRRATKLRALGVEFLEVDAEQERLHTKGRKVIQGNSCRPNSGEGF